MKLYEVILKDGKIDFLTKAQVDDMWDFVMKILAVYEDIPPFATP